MSVVSQFSITPQTAIQKFLVDMRMTSERTFRRWSKILIEAIDDCQLSPRERAALLQFHPLDDYFFGGVVALHAHTIRVLFPAPTAEALMRALAVEVDRAVGRSDSVVSHIVFMALNQIRRGHLQYNDIAHDHVVETLLERIGIDRHKATRHLMTQMLLRQTLSEPLALAIPNWWQTFRTLYAVVPPPRAEAPVHHVVVIDPGAEPQAGRPASVRISRPPAATAPEVDPHIMAWITSKYRSGGRSQDQRPGR